MLRFGLLFLLTISLPLFSHVLAVTEEEGYVAASNETAVNGIKVTPPPMSGNEEKDSLPTLDLKATSVDGSDVNDTTEAITTEDGVTTEDITPSTGNSTDSVPATTVTSPVTTGAPPGTTGAPPATTKAPPVGSSTKVPSSTEAATQNSTDGSESKAPRPTFPPAPSSPAAVTGSSVATGSPLPTMSERSGPPTWALVLMSLMLSFSLIFTAFFFLRRYCVRKRKEERRYLLDTRSQEGFFFGETSGQFGEGL